MSDKKPLGEGYQPKKGSYEERGYRPSTTPNEPIKPPPPGFGGKQEGKGPGKL